MHESFCVNEGVQGDRREKQTGENVYFQTELMKKVFDLVLKCKTIIDQQKM